MTELRAKLEEHFQRSAHPAVVAAYLYGSHGGGRPHRESDVDVAVVLDASLSRQRRFDLRLELIGDVMGALHFNEVDLIVLNDAPPLLAAHVVQRGIPVYIGDPEAEHAFRRDIQLRAGDLGAVHRALPPPSPGGDGRMTFLVERLGDIERYLDHLETLRPRLPSADALARDLSLHNDVLFSLLMVGQMVVDVSAEISSRHKLAFSDYTQAVRNLAQVDYPPDLVTALARLPGFRNVLIHEYVELDYGRVLAALHGLEEVRRFVRLVAERELPD